MNRQGITDRIIQLREAVKRSWYQYKLSEFGIDYDVG